MVPGRMTYRLSIAAVFLILALPLSAGAHPGGTNSSGCHYCRTNCSNWGLSTGEYHCHNAKSAYQPESPIHSVYGPGGTGYTIPAPDYEYSGSSYTPSYTTPSCPLHSSYDSLSSSCKCSYGYVVQGSSCVDGDSVCHDDMGYYSSYDTLSKSCECDHGYVLGASGQCVSHTTYCTENFGSHTKYNTLTDRCECADGYTNDGNNRCISMDTYCRDTIGIFARYNSLSDTCGCMYGYILEGGKCVEEEDEPETTYPSSAAFVPVVTTPAPKPEPEKKTYVPVTERKQPAKPVETKPEAKKQETPKKPLFAPIATTSTTTPPTVTHATPTPTTTDQAPPKISFIAKLFQKMMWWRW